MFPLPNSCLLLFSSLILPTIPTGPCLTADPFSYLNINISWISSSGVLDGLTDVVRGWVAPCDHGKPRSPSKQLTKLDQKKLDDLIERAGGANGHQRRKRALDGNFTISTYLREKESPFEVVSHLEIPEGVTVNVEKGVEMRFRTGFGLTVRGRLVARGTRDDPILLQAFAENNRWKGITFQTLFKPYDTKLTSGQGGSDGYLEIYDGREWRLMCSEGWTKTNSDVACEQMGFERGASTELPTIAIGPVSKSYWLFTVDCVGSEKSLKECRSQQIAGCQRPVVLQCLGETTATNFSRKQDASILEYVNCSDTEQGIVVRSTTAALVPTLNFVTAQNSMHHGVWIDVFYAPGSLDGLRLYKCLLVNNRVTGLFLQLWYPQRESLTGVIIEESLATVGGGDGIKIEGRGNVQIVRSAAFGNGRNGIDISLESGTIKLDELVFGANSGRGLSISTGNTSSSDRFSVSLSNSKFSGHWADAASVFDTSGSTNLSFTIERNEYWENYAGCVSFPSTVADSDVTIGGNNFTRNRGRVVRFSSVGSEAMVRLEKNLFHLNILNSNSSVDQAVVTVDLSQTNGGGPSVTEIFSNSFTKNTMHECISISPLHSTNVVSSVLSMDDNILVGNLVTSTVFVDVTQANITGNTFSNPVSQCELRTGPYNEGDRIDAENNFWGSQNEEKIRMKICDGIKNKTLSTADIEPWDTAAPPGLPQTAVDSQPDVVQPAVPVQPLDSGTYNGQPTAAPSAAVVQGQQPESYEIAASGKPYSVTQDLLVGPKSTLTVAPGAVLEFDTDRGLHVRGTLIAKGTEDEPIIFRAAACQTWNGITFDNQDSPSSVLEHCIIDGARIGLYLNSDKLAISKCIVSNSVLSGIILTDNSGDLVDLGDSTVLNAQDIGLRMANRYRSIQVKNFNVDNTGGNGIDFDHPVVNISFTNCRLSNSRRYGLHVDQMMFSKQTFVLNNCTVINQNGVGGVYLVARDYNSVTISNTIFSNNNAKSLIVDLKCNFTGELESGHPSRLELIDNRYENNNDNVIDVSLAYCAYADISRNVFLSNNLDHRYGVFHLQLDPLKRPNNAASTDRENFRVDFRNNLFRQNSGDYSAYMLPMSMADFIANINSNRFIENENRRSVLVLGSPLFRVNYNDFDNRKSTYNLEAEYSDGQLMDASNNYWGTVRENEIHDTIFDGTKIPYRGMVKFIPYLLGGSSSTGTNTSAKCDQRANCRGNGECVADQVCACFPGYVGDECQLVSCRDLGDCNRNGRCISPNQCQCYDGWTGADCKSAMCFGLSNCSSHGECVSLNECQCETGWTGADCSVSASGQGNVTSGPSGAVVQPNATTIQNGTGVASLCKNGCGGHGRCVRNGVCECETGWIGPSCDAPDCSGLINKNCSRHGTCVAPQQCQCENGFSGADCGVCTSIGGQCTSGITVTGTRSTPPGRTIRSVATVRSGISARTIGTTPTTQPTVQCQQVCQHGFCDTRTGTCHCYGPWTGMSCDQCARATCGESGIQFLSPDSAPAALTPAAAAELSIRVVGSNFTRPTADRYICRYGEATSTGTWISDTEVDCAVPSNRPASSVDFSMAPFTTQDSAHPLDSLNQDRQWITAPAYFSFYDTCGATACGEGGFCFRGSCYCTASGTGLDESGQCQDLSANRPNIDTNILPSLANVRELEPLRVQLTTEGDSKAVRWELLEGPFGASVDPATGLLTWPMPLGSSDPTKFAVAAHSPNGADSISWSVTVPMSYHPTIDRLINSTTANGTVKVEGHVDFLSNGTNPQRVPVQLTVYRNGQPYDEFETWTDSGGKYEYSYGPPAGDGGRYSIVAVHPGNDSKGEEVGQGVFEWTAQSIKVSPRYQLAYYDQPDRASLVINVENLGTVPLHIAEIAIRQTPPNLLNISKITINGGSSTLTPAVTLESRWNTTLNIDLVLLGTVPPDRLFPFEVRTTENASASFTIQLKRSSPGPWLSADPPNLRYVLVSGEPWPTTSIKISNDGRATARGLIVQLSTDSFLDVVDVFKNGVSILSNRTFDLAPGDNVVLSIAVAPPSDLPGATGNYDFTGRTYNGNVTVDYAAKDPTLVPLQIPYVIEFRASSMMDRFSVVVSTVDAKRATTTPVPGAAVTLSNPFMDRNKTTTTDANGIAQFTNVPTGYFLVSVDRSGYVPFRRLAKLSLSEPAQYNVTLVDYLASGGQSTAEGVQLMTSNAPTGDGGLQLSWPSTATQNVTWNGVSLDPRDVALPLDNITQIEKMITVRNKGPSTVLGFSMNTNDTRLPVLLQSDPVSIPANETRVVRLSITPNAQYHPPLDEQQCHAYLVDFYYHSFPSVPGGSEKTALLLKERDGYQVENVKLCEIDPSTAAIRSRALGLTLNVSCDCRSAVIRQCLATYTEPLAPCGPVLSTIANSTTDLGAFLNVMAGLVACNAAKVNLDKGKETVGCLISMSDTCSGTVKLWRRRTRRDLVTHAHSTPSQFFNQIQLVNSVSSRLGNPFGQLFPFLLRDSMESQSGDLLQYFGRWFNELQLVLGTTTLYIPTDPWYGEFLRSISDASAGGEALTEEEEESIVATLNMNHINQRSTLLHLLDRWNWTVNVGHRQQSSQSGEGMEARQDNAVPPSTLNELIYSTDVLNALAASQGFPANFFQVLDRDVNNLRVTLSQDNEASPCLLATIKVEPVDLDEGDRLTLQLSLKNLLNSTAIQLNEMTPRFRSVSSTEEDSLVSFSRAESKYPSAALTAVDGDHFEYWSVETETRRRLTTASRFRADILLVYSQVGLRIQTQTLIQSLPFTVQPRASIKVLYFLYAPVASSVNNSQRPNVMVALMNNGYRQLANVSVNDAQLKVTESTEHGRPVPFRLARVLIDGREEPVSFNVQIPLLKSGQVKYVQYYLASSTGNAKSQLANFRATVLVNGEFLRWMSQDTFWILQWLNDSGSDAVSFRRNASGPSSLLLGVETANGIQPAYIYNSKTTLLAPINKAELVGTSEGWITYGNNNKSYYHIRLQYLQNTQANRPGALYGEYGLPDVLNVTNDLLMGSRGNVTLDPSHIWISYGAIRGTDEETNRGRILNFVDPRLPSNQQLVTYEFVFGPKNTEGPTFGEWPETITVSAPRTAVGPGEVVGTVSAVDPDGDNVTYGLYGGDGYFVINPTTGEIKIGRTPLPTEPQRFCLNAAATDGGYPPKTAYVPIQVLYGDINSNETQAPCEILPNIDLMPNNAETARNVTETETETRTTETSGNGVTEGTRGTVGQPVEQTSTRRPGTATATISVGGEEQSSSAGIALATAVTRGRTATVPAGPSGAEGGITAVSTGRPRTTSAGGTMGTSGTMGHSEVTMHGGTTAASTGETGGGGVSPTARTTATAFGAGVTEGTSGTSERSEVAMTMHGRTTIAGTGVTGGGGLDHTATAFGTGITEGTSGTAGHSEVTQMHGGTGGSGVSPTATEGTSGQSGNGGVTVVTGEPGHVATVPHGTSATEAGSTTTPTEHEIGEESASTGNEETPTATGREIASTIGPSATSTAIGGEITEEGEGPTGAVTLTQSQSTATVSSSPEETEISPGAHPTSLTSLTTATGSSSGAVEPSSPVPPLSPVISHPLAPVTIAQNEDELSTEASVEEPSGPPIQNTPLPVQGLTPGFLPPEVIQGLGNEVNVANLTADDLVMLACKLRGARPVKPIWGIICDLGKAAGGQSTAKPSNVVKRLLDQIR